MWDNTTSCAGDCEQVCIEKCNTVQLLTYFQRFFLSDKRGPPLIPVKLEGTGEVCEKCPCGQKCMYVHQETSQNIVLGSLVFLFNYYHCHHYPHCTPRQSPHPSYPLCGRHQFHSSGWWWGFMQTEGSFIFHSKKQIYHYVPEFYDFYAGPSMVWLHYKLLQHEEPHGGGWDGGVGGVQRGVQHWFVHAVW